MRRVRDLGECASCSYAWTLIFDPHTMGIGIFRSKRRSIRRSFFFRRSIRRSFFLPCGAAVEHTQRKGFALQSLQFRVYLAKRRCSANPWAAMLRDKRIDGREPLLLIPDGASLCGAAISRPVPQRLEPWTKSA